MKRYILLSMFAGALLCSSCVKTEMLPDKPLVPVKTKAFGAVLPDGISKVFQPGDSLTAYRLIKKSTTNGSINNEKYTYLTTESGNAVQFQSKTGAAPTQLCYAVYPCVSDSLRSGIIYMKVPDVQDAVKDAVDPKADIFIGSIINGETLLKSVTTYIYFTIDQDKVASCEISSPSECLGGGVRTTVMDTMLVEKSTGWTKSVTVKGEFEKGSTYAAAICPSGKFSSFNIVLKNKDGIVMWDSSVSGDFDCYCGKSVNIGNVGNPDAAVVSIKLKSSEFAGYKVSSVIAYKASDMSKAFGGSVDVTLADGQEESLEFFGVNPADYSSTDLYYLISMSKDGDVVNLPVKVKGPNIGKSAEVEVNLGTIGEASNSAPWYCPHQDRRLQCGDGYAFGDANTYLIQYKASTYSGTADPDPSIPEEVVIDYRVRGDFFTAPRPENVTFEWKMGYTVSSTSVAPKDADWGVFTGDRSKITNGRNFTFTQDAEHFTVTVKNTGAHAQAPILIMKDATSGEILWSWAFWNIASDGTRINETVDYGGAKLCKLDIGQASTQIEKFAAKCEIRRTAFYYQWGRSTPVFWQNTTRSFVGYQDANNANGARMSIYGGGAISIKEAIQHPGDLLVGTFTKGTANTAINDWNASGMTSNSDLWGADSKAPKTTAGKKSIYDPCPKGWRVVDYMVFSQFATEDKGYAEDKYTQGKVSGYEGVYLADGLIFACQGNLVAKVDANVAIGNNGFGIGGTCTSNNHWWTNALSGSNASSLQIDYYWTKCDRSAVNANRTIKFSNKTISTALPVRCQVDNDNR